MTKDDEKAPKAEDNFWSTLTAGMYYVCLLVLVAMCVSPDLVRLAILLWIAR